ncbi:RND superfamily transporter [Campylobacter blaseri]|uniref:SSD domain-containing protein n=1 Tax=Campylobacter blaseri TaxID=2042961 RepID=A0A2P8QZH4_9BACT|nr:MMPL family transporter [Campylobacter blaseri]PSM51645.1 hypothetical protein CQ405_07575 [Campylobacter blaseri]PSM53438.1 hypothetical protein CRN67_07580 [Campylobacter blaseri]QKF86734.1 RND superfamily transporter [Campylobacter blaseri]
MNKIFRFIVACPKTVLSAILILFLFFGFYSTKFQIDASTETLLLENDKDLEIAKSVYERYKTPNFLVIAYTPNSDLLSEKTLKTIRDLSQDLTNLKFVDSVLNLTNVPLLENKEGSISEKAKDIQSLNSLESNKELAKKEFLTSPLYKESLVSKDFKTTSIVVNLKPNTEYNELIKQKDKLFAKKDYKKSELKEINKKIDSFNEGYRKQEHENIISLRNVLSEYKSKTGEEFFLGGINMIADDMVTFVKNDIYTYGIASLIMLIFCLWIFFRQARFVIIPIIICIVSAIIASGLFALLGYKVTVISSNYAALQIIITVSVAIHLVVSYREKSSLYPSRTQKQLVYTTLKDRFLPCFFAIFTTAIGFFSLILSDIKPIISLGTMMSIGISISLVLAFAIFGSIMSLLDKIEIKTNFEKSFKLTTWCANLAIKRKKEILIFFGIVFVAGLYGITFLKVENSFIGYFKDHTEIHKGMVVIDKKLGGTVPFDVVIKFKKDEASFKKSGDDILDSFELEFMEAQNQDQYWFSSEKMRIITKVHDFLASREFVGNVASLGTLLEVGKRMNNGVALNDFMLSVIYNELPSEYKSLILSPYIDIDANEARFAVRTIDSDDRLRRNEFLTSLKKDLNTLLKDDNVEVQISGVMVLYNNMLQSLVGSQINTLGFVVIAILLVFIAIFRSLKFAIIAIVVNIIPLTFVFGVMGLVGIPLDIMSITIAAISIGIGVDDVIHYIHRYRIEKKYKNPEQAVYDSHKSIGYAMQYTSIAIFLGFCVMVASNFWPTIYFGLLVDMVMAFMLISALVFLPVLIIIFSKKNIQNR